MSMICQQKDTEGRSSSHEFVKKFLSHFVPDKLQSWNIRRKEGNPTRSVAVNNLIKLVKKNQVRHQGKKSQACTPFTEKEYKHLMACLELHPNLSKRFFGSGIIKYQYIMGACINDSSKALGTYDTKMFSLCLCFLSLFLSHILLYSFFLTDYNLKPNPNTSMNHLSCVTQLCWSKNVNKERNALDWYVSSYLLCST